MLQASLGLSVDVPRGEVRVRPLSGMGAIEATGLRIAGHPVAIALDRAGGVRVSGLPDALRVIGGEPGASP